MWVPDVLVAKYGAFCVREVPPRMFGNRALPPAYYVITMASESTAEFSITQLWNRRSDLPAVLDAVRKWLQYEPVQVAIREQELEENQSPSYRADLQRAMDEDPNSSRRTADEHIAYQEHELDVLKARYALVRERLRELEAQADTKNGC